MKVLDGKRMASVLLFLALLVFLTTALALLPRPALAAQQEERPLLMIVIGFEGGGEEAVPYSNVYDWGEALFSDDESLAAYYRDQSQGLFSLVPARETSAFGDKQNTNRGDCANDGVVHVNLDSAHHAWSLVNEDVNVKEDFDQTVADSFDAARTFVDFDAYDENDDGRITSDELIVIVCTPGYDASGLGQTKRSDLPLLWPHSGTIDDVDGQDDSKTLPYTYIAVAENFIREGEKPSEAQREPIGIIAHELGHCLGLPDLYALNDASEQGSWAAYKVGILSLMAKGAWAQALDDQRGWVFRPTSLDPWSLAELGWCDPLVVEEEGDYHLYSRSSDMDYNALLVPTADPNQYFLLENRQPEGWDVALESVSTSGNLRGGVVIWHVDTGICERYRAGNQINDTDHRPGIMPVFFERDESGMLSSNWVATTPDLELPFFSMTSIAHSFGDADADIELPLYESDEDVDAPEKRMNSGISIQVLSEPGKDMVVRVKQVGNSGETSLSSPWEPPVALIVFLIALCAAGTAALALNVARRSS